MVSPMAQYCSRYHQLTISPLYCIDCICVTASLCQGIVSGMYYGALFGVASKLVFRRDIYKIKKFSGSIVAGNIAYGAIGFTTFSAVFSISSCQLSRMFPDDEVRPFIKGFSGFVSTYMLAFYESRCPRVARYVSPSIFFVVFLICSHHTPSCVYYFNPVGLLPWLVV